MTGGIDMKDTYQASLISSGRERPTLPVLRMKTNLSLYKITCARLKPFQTPLLVYHSGSCLPDLT
jgi:hypothetical protein